MTTLYDEVEPGSASARFWVGAAYFTLLAVLAVLAFFASMPLSHLVGSCEGDPVFPFLVATVVGAAAVPAVAALPRCRALIPESARMAALVIPGAILGLYSLVALSASAFGAAGGRWTLMLLPVIDVAPLASLFGSAIVVCFSGRRRHSRQIGIVVWIGFLLIVTTVASLLRTAFGCAS